jgi:hypothetical protein
MSCEYSILILEKEINILNRCLSEWEAEKYPEARKQRDMRLEDLKSAVESLELLKINSKM